MSSENSNKWILENPPDPECIPAFPTVGLALWDRIKKLGKNIAQIDGETGASDTYEEFLSRAVKMALALKARNIVPGDVISLCTHQHRDTWTPILAAFLLNVIFSPIDTNMPVVYINHVLSITKPRVMFCSPETLSLVTGAIKTISLDCEIVVLGETQEHTPFEDFLKENKEEETFQPQAVDPMSTAVVMCSSGTTGLPKGIDLNHYSLLYQFARFSKCINASVCQMYGSSAAISNMLFKIVTILQGGHQIYKNGFDAVEIPKLIETYKISCLNAAVLLLPHINWKSNDVSSLKSIIVGGTFARKETIVTIKTLVPNADCLRLYGMTENAIVCVMFDPVKDKDLMNIHVASFGKVTPGNTIKVVDVDTGEIVGPNTRGECLVKSKCLLNGYYNDPEKTKIAFDSEGFFKTGDIVYYNEDHCFYFVDRFKDTFKTPSQRVYPSELESILLAHPDISEAVVFGVPNKLGGDSPMAVVVLKNGSTCKAKDIIEYLNGKVSDHCKLQDGLTILKNIPLSYTQKYCRYKLREMFLSGQL